MPTGQEVKNRLEQKLMEMAQANQLPDVITFAGNGEPTLHPDFSVIIADTVRLRDRLAPKARIAVLSNATRLHKPAVVAALLQVDDNIQKLDSGIEATIKLIDRPQSRFSLSELVGQLTAFNGKVTVQTMFVKGSFQGEYFDNTTPEELEAWLNLLADIRPGEVMIYTLARDTASKDLVKIPADKLNEIAERVQALGIPTQVSA